jgi:hypothetical protein
VRGSWDSGAAGNFPSPAPQRLDLVAVLLGQSRLRLALRSRYSSSLPSLARVQPGSSRNRATHVPSALATLFGVSALRCTSLRSRNRAIPSRRFFSPTPASTPPDPAFTTIAGQSGPFWPQRSADSQPAQVARLFRFQRPPSNFLALLMKVNNSRITFETAG